MTRLFVARFEHFWILVMHHLIQCYKAFQLNGLPTAANWYLLNFCFLTPDSVLGSTLSILRLFPLSGFTYSNTSNQDKQSHEAGYQLANLGFPLCVHIKEVALAESDQSQRWVSDSRVADFTQEDQTVALENSEAVTHTLQTESNTDSADKAAVGLCVCFKCFC